MMHLESVQLKGGIFLPRLISASALPLRNWKHEKLRLLTCMFRSALLTNTLSTFKLSSLRPLNNKLPVKIESRLQNTTAAIFYKKHYCGSYDQYTPAVSVGRQCWLLSAVVFDSLQCRITPSHRTDVGRQCWPVCPREPTLTANNVVRMSAAQVCELDSKEQSLTDIGLSVFCRTSRLLVIIVKKT